MVGLLLKYIRAERLRLWDLHLQAAVEMLPFLAASGHNLYVMSVKIYQQEMAKIKTSYSEISKAFERGVHTIKRSKLRWAGLSAYLVIVKEHMRSLKTSGGPTTWGGVTKTHLGTFKTNMPWDRPLDGETASRHEFQEERSVTLTTPRRSLDALENLPRSVETISIETLSTA